MPLTPRPEHTPIERWLQLSLAERYADTLREPVPESLLELLNEIDG